MGSHFICFLNASLFSLLSLLVLLHHVSLASDSDISVEFLFPNFAISYNLCIDDRGVFLTSKNGLFQAAMFNFPTQSSFYFSIFHQPTSTIIWTANRDDPTTELGPVSLTSGSLAISDQNGMVLWSTPKFKSAISALQLLDTGNLKLVDENNLSLWQSFDYPTDTIISSQLLRVGSYLSSPASSSNLNKGDYKLSITTSDLILTWFGSIYWRLSNDVRSIQDSNAPVSSMVINTTGLDLLASDGSNIYQVFLPQSDFRVVNLGYDGRLRITSYTDMNSSSSVSADFTAPSDVCNLPNFCNSLGLCYYIQNSSACACPSHFNSFQNGSCLPDDGSTLESSITCKNLDPSRSAQYVTLDSGIGYFSTKFETPAFSGGDVSSCRDFCTKNCTCKGFFFDNSSFSCYLLETNHLGSLFSSGYVNQNAIGYIKTLVGSAPSSGTSGTSNSSVAIVLPSIIAALFITVIVYVAYRWCQKRRGKQRDCKSKSKSMKRVHLGRHKSSSEDRNYTDRGEDDSDDILIPGLLTRFTYTEIEAMTNDFQTKIGSGGFGVVFKGELPDKSLVAIKRTGVGIHGKKGFLTEIAMISNIRHVNLVRLRGFCGQGSHRLLVYEFVNFGSLDKVIFGDNYVLNLAQRVQIAIDTAAGLAYLHHSCNPRILHLDVKPENILLTEHFQAKISDFGLSRLMDLNRSKTFTLMKGTRGYLAPEWLMNDGISPKTDVYSYGMVLLEIITGKRNTFYEEPGKMIYIPALAVRMHSRGSYLDLVDRRLESNVEADLAERLVRVALCCLHLTPNLRPSMADVVNMLGGEMPIWEPKFEALRYLKRYEQDGPLESVAQQENNADKLQLVSSISSSMQQLSGPR